ncbi:MAG TPA: DUF305 domain-containing protein [Gemmatimonadaceae bacterium]
MTSSPRWRRGASTLAAVLAALGVAAARLPAQGASTAPHDYTQADVHFVQGMIYHHAQAVVMSEWAPTHGARPQLQTLCKRIALSQRDEITTMQNWLRDRRLPIPDPLHMLRHDHADSTPGQTHDSAGMAMPGMDMSDHPMTMPGMLTPEEMHRLDAAHGDAFDRLYLTGMIRHHQGALDMVATLFATPGAGQQSDLFALATDVDAGQRAEIARMQAMLNTLTASQTK